MLQMAFLSIAATGIKEAKIRAKLSRSHTGQGPCARQSVRLRRCFLRRAVLGVRAPRFAPVWPASDV